jgi:hypothetical protein
VAKNYYEGGHLLIGFEKIDFLTKHKKGEVNIRIVGSPILYFCDGKEAEQLLVDYRAWLKERK